jgi:site-specific recombinase XerC
VQAWRIVKQCSERARCDRRALRDSRASQERGDKVDVWSHVFRHNRATQTHRHTDAVRAQQVLGHGSLQPTSRYLKYNVEELTRRVASVPV